MPESIKNLAALQRDELIQKLKEENFDLIIIGGGITGAGIALDAQSRGLKTALIEMQDFGAGTSSRSTKLIHGGLRYLKQFQFKMVSELGRERIIIQRLAPHLTIAEPIILPIIKGGSFNKFTAFLGLLLYDFLANVRNEEKSRILSKSEVLKREPLLSDKDLEGGILFYEYKTDDSRLTIEVIKEAQKNGAAILNYIKGTGFQYNREGEIDGVVANNELTNEIFSIKGRKVINASGPWVDNIDALDISEKKKHLKLSKGIHLVFDRKKLPLSNSLYFEIPDKRMVFAICKGEKVYIGTTDTFYDGDIKNPSITKDDKIYLLNALNYALPAINLKLEDIESMWSGLRPLIFEEGKPPSEVSRKDEIFKYSSGLLTIAGGKLTGFRKMAEKVVDMVVKEIEKDHTKKFKKSTTKNLILGCSANPIIENKTDLTEEETNTLKQRYWAGTEDMSRIKNTFPTELPFFIYSQLIYCIEKEMVQTPLDFLVRRTGFFYFNIDLVLHWKDEIIEFMSHYFNWTESKKNNHQEELETQLSLLERK